jgi:hypothetical protein
LNDETARWCDVNNWAVCARVVKEKAAPWAIVDLETTRFASIRRMKWAGIVVFLLVLTEDE